MSETAKMQWDKGFKLGRAMTLLEQSDHCIGMRRHPCGDCECTNTHDSLAFFAGYDKGLSIAREIAEIKVALEHAPEEPGPIAEGLVGWVTHKGTMVCSTCAGRLIKRGMSHLVMLGSKAVWEDEEAEFECQTHNQ